MNIDNNYWENKIHSEYDPEIIVKGYENNLCQYYNDITLLLKIDGKTLTWIKHNYPVCNTNSFWKYRCLNVFKYLNTLEEEEEESLLNKYQNNYKDLYDELIRKYENNGYVQYYNLVDPDIKKCYYYLYGIEDEWLLRGDYDYTNFVLEENYTKYTMCPFKSFDDFFKCISRIKNGDKRKYIFCLYLKLFPDIFKLKYNPIDHDIYYKLVWKPNRLELNKINIFSSEGKIIILMDEIEVIDLFKESNFHIIKFLLNPFIMINLNKLSEFFRQKEIFESFDDKTQKLVVKYFWNQGQFDVLYNNGSIFNPIFQQYLYQNKYIENKLYNDKYIKWLLYTIPSIFEHDDLMNSLILNKKIDTIQLLKDEGFKININNDTFDTLNANPEYYDTRKFLDYIITGYIDESDF